MKSVLKRTVTAIAEAALTDQLGAPPEAADAEAVGALLLQKLEGMPRFLGGGMRGVTLLFELAPLPTRGRPYHRLPLGERQARLKALKSAPLPALRDFVSFYEKMGVFAYYCRVEAQGAHGEGGEARP